ncbi:M15 family metallopeptidase [Aquimarina mytili]|uniref:D-alanyl-D-alanine dipeptidase n=1 Tax=Aquimarina mytili TaxID=874423 RepID=A0A936ZUQ2_9FLAO|nr:M15 family metallopeptidase [Aquimarina mytili]MBL0682253.1 M15 family metallopeptidase [Aquimarina mytili]
MIYRIVVGVAFFVLFFSCKDVKKVPGSANETTTNVEKPQVVKPQKEANQKDTIAVLDHTTIKKDVIENSDFINIEQISGDFVLDMKYATSDNFLKEKVYSCAKCYIRKNVAEALIKANKDFIKQGYKIKFFDCYRPHSVQKKMWKIFPNPGYVADPKGGSIHNKGAAVDITLVKLDESLVDMGTGFDHFGKEAHHAYSKHSEAVLANRKLLRETMKKHGFKTIRTEWWHYNFYAGKKYQISNFEWECD